MIDIVIPLGIGSRWQDNELRYCLRAIEKNLTNYANIWIIGRTPDWITNINHIPYKDQFKIADYNIMLKIKKACEEMMITDRFLFMNDDHYILKPFDAETFPNYYEGTCQDMVNLRGSAPYGKKTYNTFKHLSDNNLPTDYFDVHFPIIYQKDKFIDRVVSLNWSGNGYVIKSLYGNYEPYRVKTSDCKSQYLPLTSWSCYSTTPQIQEGVKLWFKKTFTEKSVYEK